MGGGRSVTMAANVKGSHLTKETCYLSLGGQLVTVTAKIS